jgi:arabinose-5-phosphate isomerase
MFLLCKRVGRSDKIILMSTPQAMRPIQAAQILQLAASTFSIEAEAILAMAQRLDDDFVQVVQRMLATRGRVVVTGMGKSGHVGRKIAATLASTGTPAFFVHPGEASHGDLGMVTGDDVVLAISNSGESAEIAVLLPVLKRLGVPVVAMTGNRESAMARYADWVLDTHVDKEACPLNLAPTASTTAQMAMGDALAVALLEARGFKAEDFARSHPGGALGRRLLTHVADVMRTGDEVPRVLPNASFSDLMREMSAKGMGAAAIVDAQGVLQGIFTDGDLRRRIEAGADLRHVTASEVMYASPRQIAPDALAADAAAVMEAHRITSVLVTDASQHLVGIVHIGDLMRAKVI